MTEAEFEQDFCYHFKRTTSFFSGLALAFVDAAIILLCIGVGFFIVNAIDPPAINFRSFIEYSLYLPPILIVFYAANLYPGILIAPQQEVKRFSLCTFFAFIGIAMSINIETRYRWPIATALVIAWPFATVLLPSGREYARISFGKRNWWGVPAVVYSKGTYAYAIVDRLLKNRNFGYIPVVLIADRDIGVTDYHGVPVFYDTKELRDIIRRHNIKVAIVCDYDKDIERIQTNYRYMIQVPKNQLATNMSLHMRDFGGILGFSSVNYLTKESSLFAKRCIDILMCIIASPFALLLTAIIALIIKKTSPGPVFYGHKRIGKNHKVITCWKFRSMGTDAEEQLKHILATDPVRAAEWEKDRKFTDDPRVTPFGKILRRTSLDELPQLWNIFTGQMSFVGPRPVTESELDRYGKYADYVLSVQPGLSGMWQISGRSDTGYEERITLDTYYIQNWSVWLDIWIIIKTVWVVIKGSGAY